MKKMQPLSNKRIRELIYEEYESHDDDDNDDDDEEEEEVNRKKGRKSA